MNIIDEAIKITHQLFPNSYTQKKKSFHFAFLYKRSKLLAIGQNSPQVQSNTALKFAKRFGADQEFPYRHAEVDCFSKLWGRQLITPDMKLVVIRLNAYGQLQNSKPCKNCTKVIDGLGIKRVYWSTKGDKVESNIN